MPEQTDLALRSLEYQLRRRAPRARRDLVQSIVERPRPRSDVRQLGFAIALSAVLLIALASVGGVSYAANAVTHAAGSVRAIVVTHTNLSAAHISAGGDQYEPGYGFGDPSHNHAGPPGLTTNDSGAKAPPTQAKPTSDHKAALVAASIGADEQAALYISVLDSHGVELLLTQKGSTIGVGVDGPQTKVIHYVMLVPRTIPLQVRVPANLLVAGQTYRIRVIAVDAQGNKSRTEIPFTA